MKWTSGALFVGILALLFFLVGVLRYEGLKEQYLDRVWLDEELSVAAQDAVRDSIHCLEPGTELYPEPVWRRFLLSYQAFGGRKEEAQAILEEFPAAVLAVRTGMYQYRRGSGWGSLVPWEEDRVRQVTVWLQGCVEEDPKSASKGILYEIRLPYSGQEEWARTVGENCLVVLYEGEGGKQVDTGYFRLAIGGAQYRKRKLWYVRKSMEGVLYYHREGCRQMAGQPGEEVYYRMEECAWRGALPCPVCLR